MNGLHFRDPQIFGSLAAAGLCLGGIATYALLRRRPSPDEMERERRERLMQRGRIIDATVLDISDLGPEESGRPQGMQLIVYQYEIAGVVYECSQDVTMLRHIVNIHDCRLGFPASVRYDPHNPVNSLIVAERWVGLRDTANSVPVRDGVPLEKVTARSGGNGAAAGAGDKKDETGAEPKSESPAEASTDAKPGVASRS